MYLHPQHTFTEGEAMPALIDAHPLASWVCQGPAGLIANHLPFVLDRQRGPFGTLIGHVSRANPVWRELGSGAPSVVMFQGPQAYITPGWYPGKAAHGEVVPTWNYVAVHAHGAARAIDDRDWLLGMLDRLTNAQEAGRDGPWRVADAPAGYIDRLLHGIVGIEIAITRLEGRLKASQDEALEDRHGTVQGLRELGKDDAMAMAGLVSRAITAEWSGGAQRPDEDLTQAR